MWCVDCGLWTWAKECENNRRNRGKKSFIIMMSDGDEGGRKEKIESPTIPSSH
jgi:hypothetical protein